jgi:hypothetical protein
LVYPLDDRSDRHGPKVAWLEEPVAALSLVLLVIGGLIGLSAWILLIAAAFRVGTGWGLIVLLLGWLFIPLIVFVAQHWYVAKRPVRILAVGLAITVAGYAVGTLAAVGTFDDDWADNEGPASETAEDSSESSRPRRPTPRPTIPSWEKIVEETEKARALDRGPIVDSTPTPPPTTGGPRSITWEEAKGYVGGYIVVKLTNGTEVGGSLDAVEARRLRVRQIIGGGEAAYWITRDQVESIQPQS